MSRVVEEALKKALDDKRNKLVEDIMGAGHRYRSAAAIALPASRRVPSLRMQDFLTVVDGYLATFRREESEIDTAIQRDRDAGK